MPDLQPMHRPLLLRVNRLPCAMRRVGTEERPVGLRLALLRGGTPQASKSCQYAHQAKMSLSDRHLARSQPIALRPCLFPCLSDRILVQHMLLRYHHDRMNQRAIGELRGRGGVDDEAAGGAGGTARQE